MFSHRKRVIFLLQSSRAQICVHLCQQLENVCYHRTLTYWTGAKVHFACVKGLSLVWVVFGLSGGLEQLLDLGKEVELVSGESWVESEAELNLKLIQTHPQCVLFLFLIAITQQQTKKLVWETRIHKWSHSKSCFTFRVKTRLHDMCSSFLRMSISKCKK